MILSFRFEVKYKHNHFISKKNLFIFKNFFKVEKFKGKAVIQGIPSPAWAMGT